MMPGGGCDGAGSAPATSTSAPTAAATSTSGSKASNEGGGGGSAAGGMKKGPWTAAEDATLVEYVRKHGEGNWNAVQKNSGLSRCGKSCRLRWANHLRPNLKKGPFSPDEERLILELHAKLGNKWARMAAQLPGRTDNEIKNYWNTRIKRRQRAGLPLYPPDIQHHGAALHHRHSASGVAPSSLADHKALYSTSIGATPLSLFDPINFSVSAPAPAPAASTSPFLGLGHQPPPFHQQRAKRFREDDVGGVALPFGSANPVAPTPPLQNPFFSFNPLGGYDLNPPPPPQQQQRQQHQLSFSVKMELPSSQLFPEPSITTGGGDGGGAGGLPFLRTNSGLLDALLRETHAMGGDHSGDDGGHRREDGLLPEPGLPDVNWVKGPSGDGAGGDLSPGLVLGAAGGKWDDQGAPTNAATKREAPEDAGCVDDDLSALLELIPMAAAPAAAVPAATREWYNSDSGEVSNGQSSGVTDENVGLEMRHLASSLSMAVEEDHSWSIGSCHWNDMPGTC